MLPHATAYRREQALCPHMAVWLPQGFLPSSHVHMECWLGFRPKNTRSLGLPWNALGSAGKLGSDKAKATQLSHVLSRRVESWRTGEGHADSHVKRQMPVEAQLCVTGI